MNYLYDLGLIAVGDHTGAVVLYDRSFQINCQYKGDGAEVTSICYINDGSSLFVAFEDGTLKYYSLKAAKSEFIIPGIKYEHNLPKAIRHITYPMDGEQIYFSSFNILYCFNTIRKGFFKQPKNIDNEITSMAFSRSFRLLILGQSSGKILLLNIETYILYDTIHSTQSIESLLVCNIQTEEILLWFNPTSEGQSKISFYNLSRKEIVKTIDINQIPTKMIYSHDDRSLCLIILDALMIKNFINSTEKVTYSEGIGFTDIVYLGDGSTVVLGNEEGYLELWEI